MTDRTKKIIKNNITGYVLLIPFLVGMIFFTAYPLLLALAQSFFKDYSPMRGFFWADFGLENYKRIFTDPGIHKSMLLTLAYAAINIPINLTVSFVLAYLLSLKMRGAETFRVLVYLPAIIPGIVGASIHKYIFSENDYGLINTIRIAFGASPTRLLESKNQIEAFVSFMLTGIFSFGCGTPMWIAGFNSISKDVYEAASLDGCTQGKAFFKITIPLMGRFIFFQLLGSLIGAFQIGESVLQLSPSGGYNCNLNFYGLLIYNQTQGAGGYNYGLASALSYVLFLVVGLLSLITFRANKNVYYED